jgi:hypothetical protein
VKNFKINYVLSISKYTKSQKFIVIKRTGLRDFHSPNNLQIIKRRKSEKEDLFDGMQTKEKA